MESSWSSNRGEQQDVSRNGLIDSSCHGTVNGPVICCHIKLCSSVCVWMVFGRCGSFRLPPTYGLPCCTYRLCRKSCGIGRVFGSACRDLSTACTRVPTFQHGSRLTPPIRKAQFFNVFADPRGNRQSLPGKLTNYEACFQSSRKF